MYIADIIVYIHYIVKVCTFIHFYQTRVCLVPMYAMKRLVSIFVYYQRSNAHMENMMSHYNVLFTFPVYVKQL